MTPPKLHVVFTKEELDRERLPGKVVVVVDVLFATSTIAAALAHGAAEVIPARDRDAALEEARRRPEGSYVLSGERDATTLPGFVDATPLALLRHELSGRALVYSTTNGTVALEKASGAARVYAAALLNAGAVAEHVARTLVEPTVLVVCAGSAGRPNLEDLYGAGYVTSLLARRAGALELSDAARAALMLHEGRDAYECLSAGRLGRMMLERGLEAEVRFAARRSALEVVPRFEAGRLRAV